MSHGSDRAVSDGRLLSAQQWLGWVERLPSDTAAEREVKLAALKRAVQACYSVDLWLALLHFAQRLEQTAQQRDAPAQWQDVFVTSLADALQDTAYHFAEGHKIWALKQAALEADLAAGRITVQTLLAACQARLMIPHQDMSKTFEAYSHLVTRYAPDDYNGLMSIVSAHHDVKKVADELDLQEVKLANAADRPAQLQEYCRWMRTLPRKHVVRRHPSYRSLLFDLHRRAFHETVDVQFAQEAIDAVSVDEHFASFEKQVVSLLGRALAAHPRNANLCASAIRYASVVTQETWAALDLNPEQVFPRIREEDAIGVLEAYYFAARASSPPKLAMDGVLKYSRQILETQSAAMLQITRLLTDTLTARRAVQLARGFWQVLEPSLGMSAEYWIEFTAWEARHGEESQLRKLHCQACSSVEDAPQLVMDRARAFEARHGRLQDVVALEVLLADRRTQLREQASAVAETVAEQEVAVPMLSKQGRRRARADADDASAKRQKTEHHTGHDREHTSVVVRNMAVDTTETDVDRLFADCGTIAAVRLRSSSSAQSACYVEFADADGALAALTKTLKQFRGQQIVIEPAAQSTLFVANFPADHSEDDLMALFKPHGLVLDIRLPETSSATTRRFAYVQMSSSKDADRALSLDGADIDGCELVVKRSDPARKETRHTAASEGRELMLRNISFETDETVVRELLEPFGQIDGIRLVQKNSKKHHDGVAFVDFCQAASARTALEALDGHVLKGRQLKVVLAETERPKAPHSKRRRAEKSSLKPDPSPAASTTASATGAGASAFRPASLRRPALSRQPHGTKALSSDVPAAVRSPPEKTQDFFRSLLNK